MNTSFESKEKTLSIEILSFFDSNRLYSLGAHNYLIINKKFCLYGIVKAFGGILKALDGKDKAFHGTIKAFHGMNKASTGCLKRLTGRLKIHGINKASRGTVKANHVHGMIKAFGRNLEGIRFAGQLKQSRRTVKALAG